MTALAEQESARRRLLLVARHPTGLVVADDAAGLLARTWTTGLLLALAHPRSIQHGELERLHFARVHVSVPLRVACRRVVSGLGRLKPAEVDVMLAIMLSNTISARDDSGDTLCSHSVHIVSLKFLIKRAVLVEVIVFWSTHRRQVHATTVVIVLTFATVCQSVDTSATRALVHHILVPSLIGCCAVTRSPTVTAILVNSCSVRYTLVTYAAPLFALPNVAAMAWRL